MDPSTSLESAYQQLNEAYQEHREADLDFNKIVLPALTYLNQKKELALEAPFLEYVFTHISDENIDQEQIKSCALFLKSKNFKNAEVMHLMLALAKKSNVGLVSCLLANYALQLTLQEAKTLAFYAAKAGSIPLLKELERRQGILPQTVLKGAMEGGKEDVITLLFQRKPLPDLYDFDFFKTPQASVEILLKKMVFSRLSVDQKRSFLSEAIRKNCFPLVEGMLKQAPELLIEPDWMGFTPLEEALDVVTKDRDEDVDLSPSEKEAQVFTGGVILAHKIKAGQIENVFEPAEDDVLYPIEIIEQLTPYKGRFEKWLSPSTVEVLKEVTEEYVLRMLVGQAHSVENTEEFLYEGLVVHPFYATFIERSMAEGLEDIGGDSGISQAEKDLIIEALRGADSAYKTFFKEDSLVEIVNKIKTGALVILPTGSAEHKTAVVFCKGVMVVCNRGDRARGAPTLQAFRINPHKITEEMVEDILDVSEVDDPVIHQQIEDYRLYTLFPELAKKLSSSEQIEQDDFCRALALISQKDQKVGNCTYVSLKGALRACLALNRTDPHDRATWNRLAQAKEDSKKLTTALRLQFLNDYLEHQRNTQWMKIDANLIKQALSSIDRRLKRYPLSLDPYPLVKGSLEAYRAGMDE